MREHVNVNVLVLGESTCQKHDIVRGSESNCEKDSHRMYR